MSRHLYVVDDDAEIRDAIAFAATGRDFDVHLYESGSALLAEDTLAGPGCIVLDLRMPEIDVIVLQQKLTANGNQLPIVVVSGHATVDSTIQSFRQGVDDFLVKPVDCTQLFNRIDELIDKDDQRLRNEQRTEEDRQRYESLTNRETQVMHLLVRGLSGKQIASYLGISYRTMEKFRANVMHKFQAQSVAELVHAAFRIGLDTDTEFADESEMERTL